MRLHESVLCRTPTEAAGARPGPEGRYHERAALKDSSRSIDAPARLRSTRRDAACSVHARWIRSIVACCRARAKALTFSSPESTAETKPFLDHHTPRVTRIVCRLLPTATSIPPPPPRHTQKHTHPTTTHHHQRRTRTHTAHSAPICVGHRRLGKSEENGYSTRTYHRPWLAAAE